MCLVYLMLCKEEGSSPVSLQLLRGGIWACMKCPCLCLCWVSVGAMLANFHVFGIMLVSRAVFNMLVRNASPRGPMCFRCLMFCLSGPCELFFLLCFISSWTRVVVSVMLYPCFLCVALLMDMFVLCVACLTVFVNCLVKQFALCLGVVVIWLLNVMEVFSVDGVALLDRPCMVF